jgi:hypothetical protein
MPAENR